MPTYLVLGTWTDKGRVESATQPNRVDQVREFLSAESGVKIISGYVTIGRYDEVWLIEAVDDETLLRCLMFVAGRGYLITETLRCFSGDEMRELL